MTSREGESSPKERAGTPPDAPVRVKICGLCRPEDAAAAARAGASYLGVVLEARSPRVQDLGRARAILDAGAGVRGVGVFVDADPDTVLRVADALGLELVQLHGKEPPGTVRRLRAEGLRVWKAVRLAGPGRAWAAAEPYRAVADGLLLEGASRRGAGGVGARFDWDAASPDIRGWTRPPELVAAGGLTPENVARAVRALAPDVVDVSSGVEMAVGRKSHERLRAFVAAAMGRAV